MKLTLSLGLWCYRFVSVRAGYLIRQRLRKRAAAGKEDPDRLGERFGRAGADRPEGPLIWFHAASVGESLSVLELMRRLSQDHPDHSFLITTGTVTSAELLPLRLPERAMHQFVPVDSRDAVSRFLDHWKPDLAVWTESELWPNLIIETSKRGVPMALINARISEGSFKAWRWFPASAKALLERFDLIMAQDQVSADRFWKLGAHEVELSVMGTLKEGSAPLPDSETERVQFTSAWGHRPTWLAASTHPGEEELIAEAHDAVRKSVIGLGLILAPRHPERGDAITNTLRNGGWLVAQRSKDDPIVPETQIYVADTLGEMGIWFRASPVSFIGGSLVPIGGHNPFEPAALGSAIIHGPHVDNFRDIYTRLADADACVRVEDAHSLARSLSRVLAPDEAARIATAAWETCSDGAEVTDRVIKVLEDLMAA